MEATIGKGYNIDHRAHLEIDRGRYVAIDDDGEYVISTKPQLIRGLPYGGPRIPVVCDGATQGNRTYRCFIIDRGDNLHLAVIGTLVVHECWVWVAGDTIRNENGEDDDDEFEEYLPIMVHKYPKRKPPNKSVAEVMAQVKKRTFLKLFADMKRAGIEPPYDVNYYDLVVEPYTPPMYTPMYLRRKRKRRLSHICIFGKRHVCTLMAYIGKQRKKMRHT